MPDRAGSRRPKDAVPHPGFDATDEIQEHDDSASRRARLRWMRPASPEPDPGESRHGDYGDLLDGAIAVAALLAMVAIDLSLWLAIPLAIATYVAVALLRSSRERQDERIDGAATKPPRVAAMADDHARQQVPDGDLAGIDAVATRFGLTRREREILPLLAHRLTDREIAEQLSISHRTAMNHTANILGKLGLASRRDIAAFVAHQAVPPPHEPG